MAFEHTKAVMGGQVTVAFYDTSTLYFKSQEDDVRVPGDSKDGKKMSVMLHTDYDEEVVRLLDAIGLKP